MGVTEGQAGTRFSAYERHARLRARFDAEAEQLRGRESRFSTARLLLFLAAVVLCVAAFSDDSWIAGALGGACTLAFAVAVGLHARVSLRREAALTRRDLHDRHLARMDGRWVSFPVDGAGMLPATHPYAGDIDLIGKGSLLQRIDVTHTSQGVRRLVDWLSAPAEASVVRSRQQAVAELADAVELRQELEASARGAKGDEKLDGGGFAAFAELPALFARWPALYPACLGLPLLTAAVFAAGHFGLLPEPSWLVPLTLQVGLLAATGRRVRRAFDLVSARQGALEAFEGMLCVVERAELQAPALQRVQQRLRSDGHAPSEQLSRLNRLASYAELRSQVLLWAFVNPLLLWDLHVLRALERWNAQVGKRTADWIAALGELEALCSLATLADVDPDTGFPELTDGGPLVAQAIAHPLLSAKTRVANDLRIEGPSTVVVVTGSNMAGKSTLLRAVGLNVALGLAGGPVCARSLRLPTVRLRASMRAADELQQGASYFHAELTKLRTVVQDAERQPPILFLLDELLRGTNERARHVGARAVITHLLRRGAMGLVATHDMALAALGNALSEGVTNVHFTDVVVDGEMRFDYRLRPGIVKTSNALRLLSMAGIDVPADERRAMESPAAEPSPPGEHEPDRERGSELMEH